MNFQVPKTERFLRIKQILEIVPIGRSTVWKMVSEGRFPRPLKLSERCTVWRETDVQQWMNDRITNCES